MKKVLTSSLFLYCLFFTVTAQDNSLHFDGIDDYVDLTSALQADLTGKSDFTVEFWIKADATIQSEVRVGLFTQNTVLGGNRFLLVLGGVGSLGDPNTGQITIFEDGSGIEFTSSTVVGDNTWHHIAYTRTGGTGELFIDGNSEGTHSADIAFGAIDLYSLGQEYDGGGPIPSDFYGGNMDDVRIWCVAKTQAEIQANMNMEIDCNTADLVAYYQLNVDNTPSTDVVDCTSPVNTGTRVGAGGPNNLPQYSSDIPFLPAMAVIPTNMGVKC